MVVLNSSTTIFVLSNTCTLFGRIKTFIYLRHFVKIMSMITIDQKLLRFLSLI